MLHRKIAVLSVVLGAALLAPLAVQAATVITNTGTANYQNEAAQAQAAVNSSTVFTVAVDPVLTVVKTRDIGKGKTGTVVTYEIRVAYPRVADALTICGDDSNAVATTITDAIPAGMTFVNNSMRVSTNNGAAWSAYGTNASDGVEVGSGYDLRYAAGTMTAILGTIVEGTGDAACAGVATTLVVQFQVTVN